MKKLKKNLKKTKSSAKKKSGRAASRSSPLQRSKVKMANKQYAHFNDILLRKRDDILKLVKHQGSDFALGQGGEVGDELDAASQTFEREMMFELTNGERMILDDIEAALRRIEKGDFGFCESCHKKIPSIRLRAMPWARNCVDCQTKTETHVRA